MAADDESSDEGELRPVNRSVSGLTITMECITVLGARLSRNVINVHIMVSDLAHKCAS